MKIKEIISQDRRDFRAIYECEHCGDEYEEKGYDDSNFHNNVIPKIVCENCGKVSGKNYRPLSPKYLEGVQVRFMSLKGE